MQIHLDLSGLKQTKWNQLVVRFCIGGLITAGAGLIAERYGPEIGGLFLAFPAIFPASATLIEKHEKERKKEAGLNGVRRARRAVALDARGTAMGAIGLLTFAFIASRFLRNHEPAVVLLFATLGWATVSFFAWRIRKHKLLLHTTRAHTTEK